jgi:hypothetical protein
LIILNQEFVRKHNLKDGAIPKVAKYIEDTILEFKQKNAQLRPQTPPNGTITTLFYC